MILTLTVTILWPDGDTITVEHKMADDIFMMVDALARSLVSAGYMPQTVDEAFKEYEPMVTVTEPPTEYERKGIEVLESMVEQIRAGANNFIAESERRSLRTEDTEPE